MQMATSIEKENGEMIVKRVSVPIGLEELMEGLTKEVMLKKPKDIYVFASEYFAQLLDLRDKGNFKKVPIRRVSSITQVRRNYDPKKYGSRKSKSVDTVEPTASNITNKETSHSKKQSTPALKGIIQISPVLDKNKGRKTLNMTAQKNQESRDKTPRASLDEGQLARPTRSTPVSQVNKVRSLEEKVKAPRNKNQILPSSRNKTKIGNKLQKSEGQANGQKPQDPDSERNLEIVPIAALNELTATKEYNKEDSVDLTLNTGDTAIKEIRMMESNGHETVNLTKTEQRTEELQTVHSKNNCGRIPTKSDVQTVEELENVTLDGFKEEHRNQDEPTGEIKFDDEEMSANKNIRTELQEVPHKKTSTEKPKLDTTGETVNDDRTEKGGAVEDIINENSKQVSEESENAATLTDGKCSQLVKDVAEEKAENKEMTKQKSPEANLSGPRNGTGDFISDETASIMGTSAKDMAKHITELKLNKTAEGKEGGPSNDDNERDVKSGTETKLVKERIILVASEIAELGTQGDSVRSDDGNKEKVYEEIIQGKIQSPKLEDGKISDGEGYILHEEKGRDNSSDEQIIPQLDSQVPDVETKETKDGEIETSRRDKSPTSTNSSIQKASDSGDHNSIISTEEAIDGENGNVTMGEWTKFAEGPLSVLESNIKKRLSAEDNASSENTGNKTVDETSVAQVERNGNHVAESTNSPKRGSIGWKNSEQKDPNVKGEIHKNDKLNEIQSISYDNTTEVSDRNTNTKTSPTVLGETRNDIRLQAKEDIKVQNTRTKSLSHGQLNATSHESKNKTKIRKTRSVDFTKMSTMLEKGNDKIKLKPKSAVVLKSEEKLDKGKQNIDHTLTHNNMAKETNKSDDIAKLAYAAIKIQSLWRGYRSRKKLTKKESQLQKADAHKEQTIDKENEESSEKNVAKLVEAVIKLQAFWRGFDTRKRLKNNNLFGQRVEFVSKVTESLKTPAEIKQRHADDAALKVQALWKGYKVRKNIKGARERLEELDKATGNDDTPSTALTDQDITKAAIKIQSGIRGYMVRKKFDIKHLKSISEEAVTPANKMSDDQSSANSDEMKQISAEIPAETKRIGRSQTVEEPEMVKEVNNMQLGQTGHSESILTQDNSGSRSDPFSTDLVAKNSDGGNSNFVSDTEHKMDRKLENQRLVGIDNQSLKEVSDEIHSEQKQPLEKMSIDNHSLKEMSDDIDNEQPQEKEGTESMGESNLSVDNEQIDESKNHSVSKSNPVLEARNRETHLDCQKLTSDTILAIDEAQNSIQENASTNTLVFSEMDSQNETKTDDMEHMKEESRPLSLESTTSNDSAVTVIVKSNPAQRNSDLDISDNGSTRIVNDSEIDSKKFSIEKLGNEIEEATESIEVGNKSSPISSVATYVGEAVNSDDAKSPSDSERATAKDDAILTDKINDVTQTLESESMLKTNDSNNTLMQMQKNEDETSESNEQSNNAKIVNNEKSSDSDKSRTDPGMHVSSDSIIENTISKFPTHTTNVHTKPTLEEDGIRKKSEMQNRAISKDIERDMIDKQNFSTADLHLAENKKEMNQNESEQVSSESSKTIVLFETNTTQLAGGTDRNRETQNDMKSESARNTQEMSVSETMPGRIDTKSGDGILLNVGDETEEGKFGVKKKETGEKKEEFGSKANQNHKFSENNKVSLDNESDGSAELPSTRMVLGYDIQIESHLPKHIENGENETNTQTQLTTGSMSDKPGYEVIPESLFTDNKVDDEIESTVTTDRSVTRLSTCEKNELENHRGNAGIGENILNSKNNEQIIGMPGEILSKAKEANQSEIKDSSELNNELDSSAQEQLDAQGYVPENKNKKNSTTKMTLGNERQNQNRLIDHSFLNNIIEDSKKEGDHFDSDNQKESNEGSEILHENGGNNRSEVKGRKQGDINIREIATVTKSMIPNIEPKSGTEDPEVIRSESVRTVQNQTGEANNLGDNSFTSTKDMHDEGDRINITSPDDDDKVSFSIGNEEIFLNKPTRMSEDNRPEINKREVNNVRSKPDSSSDEHKRNNKINLPANVETHEIPRDRASIEQEEDHANSESLGIRALTEPRKLTEKTRNSIDLTKLDEEVKNHVKSYHPDNNRTANLVRENEYMATIPKGVEVLENSSHQIEHKEIENISDDPKQAIGESMQLDDKTSVEKNSKDNDEMNFERPIDSKKQLSDKANGKVDLTNLRDEVASYVRKCNINQHSDASAEVPSNDNLYRQTPAEDLYTSQENEVDVDTSQKLQENLYESELNQDDTKENERINDSEEISIENDQENKEKLLPELHVFSDETALDKSEIGEQKETYSDETRKKVDSITSGRNETHNGRKLSATTTKLVHPSEFHDTITIPFEPDSPLTQVRTVQGGSPSRTTSPGLVHTGELHDNVFPVSIQLNQVPPAGLKVLTSPRRSSDDDSDQNSIVNSIVDTRNGRSVGSVGGSVEAQASRKDASAQQQQQKQHTCAMGTDAAQSQTESGEGIVGDAAAGGRSSQNYPVIPTRDIIGNSRSIMDREKRNNVSIPTAPAKNKNMEAEAATKIQAGFRGYQVRKQLKNKIHYRYITRIFQYYT